MNRIRGVVTIAFFVGALTLTATQGFASLQYDPMLPGDQVEGSLIGPGASIGSPVFVDLNPGTAAEFTGSINDTDGDPINFNIDFLPPTLGPTQPLIDPEFSIKISYEGGIGNALDVIDPHTFVFSDLDWYDTSGNLIPGVVYEAGLDDALNVINGNPIDNGDLSLGPGMPTSDSVTIDLENKGGGSHVIQLDSMGGGMFTVSVAVRHTPIPEPSTYLMLGSMIMIVTLSKARKRKKGLHKA